MQQHRGDVVYRPTPGGGATFEVRFAALEPHPR
jgi:signal transduction histidine kinase